MIKIQKLFCIFFVALSMIGFSNTDVHAAISPPQHIEVSGGRKQTEQTKTIVEFRFTFDLVSFDGRNGIAVYDVGSYFIFDGRTIALTDHLYVNGNYVGSFTSLNGYHNKGTYYRTEKFRVSLHEGYNYLDTIGSGVGGESNMLIDIPKFQNYRVNFIDWDSTLLKSEQVFKGDNATPPSQPTRTGYDFTGWLGNYRNVTEDRTIQATYTKKKYNVRFDSVGGSYVPSQEVEYQNRVSYPSNPTRSSDKFMGWYTTSNYQQGYDFNSLVSSSFTLYAKWDKVPSITAEDIVISENMYQPDEWQKVRMEDVNTWDYEDGAINNKVVIVSDTTDLTKQGDYEIVYKVTDSVGNSAITKAKVKVIPQTPNEDKKRKYIRSINKKYLDTLKPNSKWRISTLNDMLVASLNRNESEVKSQWHLTVNDIEKIKEFNRTHDYSPESNQLFKAEFSYLRKK